MPVSKNRKDHKSKVMQYKQKLALDRKRAQEALMKLYQEQQQYRQSQMKQQINGVDVENAEVDINAEDLAVVQEQAPVVEVAENVQVETPTFDVEEFGLPTEIPVVEVKAEQPAVDIQPVVDEPRVESPMVEAWEKPIVEEKKSSSRKSTPKKETKKEVVKEEVEEPKKKTSRKK